ncbi:MAG: Spy/CpxP family protein refolding chaperone [Acidobacteriota bacterium]|nr:Spy/CpxP family protein refolding chaperone [Acidobacteriota bacterium]
MSLKNKFISTAALAFAVAAFGTFASAQNSTQNSDSTTRPERGERSERGKGDGMRGGNHGGGGGDRMMMRSLEKLDLTDAQKAQVKTIFENNHTKNQPQMEEMRDLGMKKRDGVLTAEEETRFKDLRGQMKASGDQTRDSITAILTPQQRAQFDKMRDEMREQMKERRQNRRNQTDQPMPPADN